ncbi:hypothetical protein [Streptomyces thermocoprophilus]|uniref:hypothetical protein n=1 Tax=Streptomyces thermocoprophilus TaxID=78356 RepID=UPI00406BD73C
MALPWGGAPPRPVTEWKPYGHDRPADLGERLAAAGFTPEPSGSPSRRRTAACRDGRARTVPARHARHA